MDFFASGAPVIKEGAASSSTTITDEDDDVGVCRVLCPVRLLAWAVPAHSCLGTTGVHVNAIRL